MNPLLFGRPESPLYGVYQPAEGPARSIGVVLCYPFGQEYMRSHRAYRQLALLLTKRGFPVLRFDYRGTGNSSGGIETVTAQDWLQDIGDAIDELKELAGVSRISLTGLRLGALFAAVASSRHQDVHRLLLWDPVLSGAEYADELIAQVSQERPTSYGAPSGNMLRPDGAIHFNGFLLPATFRTSLLALDLLALPLPSARVYQVVSHETAAFARLRDSWATSPTYRYHYTPAPHDWNYVDNFGGILLPQPVIQALVHWVDSEERG